MLNKGLLNCVFNLLSTGGRSANSSDFDDMWFNFGEDGTPSKNDSKSLEDREGKHAPYFNHVPVAHAAPATSVALPVLVHPPVWIVPHIFPFSIPVQEDVDDPPPEPTYGYIVRQRQDFNCTDNPDCEKDMQADPPRVVKCTNLHFR